MATRSTSTTHAGKSNSSPVASHLKQKKIRGRGRSSFRAVKTARQRKCITGSEKAHESSVVSKSRKAKVTEATPKINASEILALKKMFKAERTSGKIIRPNLKNPSASACYMNSALQMLAVAMDDKSLNFLKDASCPSSITAGLRGTAKKDCEKAWQNLRNSFCQIQYALRHSSDKETLSSGYISDFVRVLTDFGQVSGNGSIQEMLGGARSLNQVNSQQDVVEFLDLLKRIFSDCFEDSSKKGRSGKRAKGESSSIWPGSIMLAFSRQVKIDEVEGVPVYVTLKDNSLEPDSCYRMTLPLDQKLEEGEEEYYQSCLAETSGVTAQMHNTCRVESCDDAREAYTALKQKIEQGEIKLEKNKKSRALRDLQEKIDSIEGDFDTRAQYPIEIEKATIHLKKEADTLTVMYRGYKPADDSSHLPTWNDMEFMDVPARFHWPVPEGEETEATSQIEYRQDKRNGKYYFCTNLPVGGLDASERHARQQAQASIIARKIYQMTGCPALDNFALTCKNIKGKNQYYMMVEDSFAGDDPYIDQGKNPKLTPPQLDCRQQIVESRISSHNSWEGKAFIVMDAWLGHLDIINGRSGGLGVRSNEKVLVDMHSGRCRETDTLYRTEYNCFGYRAGNPRRGDFNNNAASDLDTLRKSELFQNVDDINIVIGQELLRKISEETITEIVNSSEYDGNKKGLITALIQRRKALLDYKVENGEKLREKVLLDGLGIDPSELEKLKKAPNKLKEEKEKLEEEVKALNKNLKSMKGQEWENGQKKLMGLESEVQGVRKQISDVESRLHEVDDLKSSWESPFEVPSGYVRSKDEAVRAFIGSGGKINLNNVVIDGEEREVTGHARSIVCHIGRDTHSGHYITLNRVKDRWFVMDDLLKKTGSDETSGAVSISEYLRARGISASNLRTSEREGLEAVNTLLRDRDFNAMPYTMTYELEKEESERRRQWQSDYEQQLLGESSAVKKKSKGEKQELKQLGKRTRKKSEVFEDGAAPAATVVFVPSAKRKRIDIAPVAYSSSDEEVSSKKEVSNKKSVKRRVSERAEKTSEESANESGGESVEEASVKQQPKSKRMKFDDRMGFGRGVLNGRSI